jgi:hypothetical protein
LLLQSLNFLFRHLQLLAQLLNDALLRGGQQLSMLHCYDVNQMHNLLYHHFDRQEQ